MRNRLLMGLGLTVVYMQVYCAGAGEHHHACSSSQSAEMPYVGIPEKYGSVGHSRKLPLADSLHYHIPTYQSTSPIDQPSIARRGQSASPPRGKLCTLRKSFNLSRQNFALKVNAVEQEQRRVTRSTSDAYRILTFEPRPPTVAHRVHTDMHTEEVYLAVPDAFGPITLQDYLKERHTHEMPGIFARCQYVKEGEGYFIDYALARWLQYYLEQCLIDGRIAHHPDDTKKIFSAVEFYLVDEDMQPIFLSIVPAVKPKLDPTLKKILSFEMRTIKSQEAPSGDRELLANQWFTIGTYLNSHKNYTSALAWLTKAHLELTNLEQQHQYIKYKYGHVLYAIAHTYWQMHMHNDWQSCEHQFEYLVILAWLSKAEPRLERELQPLDAAHNLFGRVYEKIGEVANNQDPDNADKAIIQMNDNSMESARGLIGKAFARYNEILKCLQRHEDSASHELSISRSHEVAPQMGSILPALINIMCLFGRQKGLCSADIASKMPMYARHLLTWKNRTELAAYQHEENTRYANACRVAREIGNTHPGMVKKMPASPRLSSSSK